MVVTALIPRGRSQSLVETDDGESMLLSSTRIDMYGLREGSELTEELYADILRGLYAEALRKCAGLLKDRDYTAQGLREKLVHRGYPSQTAEQAVSAMEKAGYVDDRRFAESYLRSLGEKRPPARIRAELLQKGVPEDLIDAAFRVWEEEHGRSPEEEELCQLRALLRGQEFEKGSTGDTQSQKLMASLYRKGYTAGLIRRAVKEMDASPDVYGRRL